MRGAPGISGDAAIPLLNMHLESVFKLLATWSIKNFKVFLLRLKDKIDRLLFCILVVFKRLTVISYLCQAIDMA